MYSKKKNLIFVSKNFGINQKELDDLRLKRIKFIPLSKYVEGDLDILKYDQNNLIKFSDYKPIINLPNSWRHKYIQQQIYKYITEKKLLAGSFKVSGTKIYATHHKWSSYPIAASEAIIELGGVSAFWQTSFYETMGLHSAVNSDIYFSFSPKLKKIEKLNCSLIKYIVSVGYIFDFNFNSAKLNAKRLSTI